MPKELIGIESNCIGNILNFLDRTDLCSLTKVSKNFRKIFLNQYFKKKLDLIYRPSELPIEPYNQNFDYIKAYNNKIIEAIAYLKTLGFDQVIIDIFNPEVLALAWYSDLIYANNVPITFIKALYIFSCDIIIRLQIEKNNVITEFLTEHHTNYKKNVDGTISIPLHLLTPPFTMGYTQPKILNLDSSVMNRIMTNYYNYCLSNGKINHKASIIFPGQGEVDIIIPPLSSTTAPL